MRSIFRQRQIEKLYRLTIKGEGIMRPVPVIHQNQTAIISKVWSTNSPVGAAEKLIIDSCDGGIICEKEIGRYDVEIPTLDVGDEFFLHDIQKVIKIKCRMRSSDGSIIYYAEDEMVETEATKKSYDECMKKIGNWENECRKYDSLVRRFNDTLVEFEKYKEKYKFQHRFFNFRSGEKK